jgi:hypothetical protein
MMYMMFAGNDGNWAEDERGILSFRGYLTLPAAKILVKNQGFTWAQLVETRFDKPYVAYTYDLYRKWREAGAA